LADADKHKDEFLAVLGHELRNPLAPLHTGTELLRMAKDRPDILDSVRPMMERQVNHLTALVNDLLDVSRISRGQIRLQLTDFDLRAVAESAIEQCLPSLRERG